MLKRLYDIGQGMAQMYIGTSICDNIISIFGFDPLIAWKVAGRVALNLALMGN